MPRSVVVGLLLAFTLVCRSLVGQAAVAPADVEAKILFHGEPVTFEVPPIIRQNRTFVPVRFVLERIHAQVTWDGVTRQVIIQQDDKRVILTIDSPRVLVNDVAKEIDVAPFILRDRTMVPLRFVAEYFGFDVSFDAASRTVLLVPPSGISPSPGTGNETGSPIAGINEVQVEIAGVLQVGERFTATVVLHNVSDLKSAAIQLIYDPVRIQAIDIQPGTIIEGLAARREFDNEKGRVQYMTALTGAKTFSGSGTYFAVHFKALQEGEARIEPIAGDLKGAFYGKSGYMTATLVPASFFIGR